MRVAPLARALMGDGRKLRRRRFEATVLTMVRYGDRRGESHELSIRNVDGRWRDGAPHSKRSMMIMRPPQHGQGAAYASFAGAGCSGGGAFSAARAMAMEATRTPFARKP